MRCQIGTGTDIAAPAAATSVTMLVRYSVTRQTFTVLAAALAQASGNLIIIL